MVPYLSGANVPDKKQTNKPFYIIQPESFKKKIIILAFFILKLPLLYVEGVNVV